MYRLKIKRTMNSFGIILIIFMILLLSARMLQYNSEIYVCRHMARDIEEWLTPLGFNVTLVVGKDQPHMGMESNGHMWVKINGIPIDSVYLLPYFVSYSPFKHRVMEFDTYEDYLEYNGRTDEEDRGRG